VRRFNSSRGHVPAWTIEVDDPRRDDVRALLEQHLAFAHEHTPPEDVHALDLDGLLHASITFFSLRDGATLLGVGALKELGSDHAEIKSMHTAAAARGRGVGRALLEHLLAVARSRGHRRVSLETGATDAFAPARGLYAAAGFVSCGPFGDYPESPRSAFMTLELGGGRCGREESNLQEPKPTGT
jgi:putative acetyltransferase